MRDNLSSLINLNRVDKHLYQPDDVFEQSRITRMERVPTSVYETAAEGAVAVAKQISNIIRAKQLQNQMATMSFAAGSSVRDIFKELVRMHREEGLSFRNVRIYNLFEFYPLQDRMDGCYGQLSEQLFRHVDILPENIVSFDGTMPKEDILPLCARMENELERIGGLDFLLLGIGRAGNIGFNEPGSRTNSQTRLVQLDNVSREDAKAIFDSVDQVPTSALSMGIGTILKAKTITMVAWGEHKSSQVRIAIEDEPSVSCPASAMQLHNQAQVVLDLGAASALTRLSYPWLVTPCNWDDRLIRRAIVWLCDETSKPILKLTNKDYTEHGLSELINRFGSAYDCNIHVFNDLQHTITGWPGGKPNADDSNRPERANPYPKDVLIFSPHPDDDVISMGGTFARLIKQGHNVHVAYETSGCIAVCDEEVTRFMDFMHGFMPMFKLDANVPDTYTDRQILDIKALIRRGEATAACRYMGLDTSHIHFLNLPFYETGAIKKGDLSQKDVDIVKNLLLELKPNEIFVAGDLADPHGTHKVCLDAVLAALDELKDTESWLHDCRIWMYRGAWMEWGIDLIQMAVPMSPEELRSKRNSILKHQSQMESAPFMGNDERLFWQRAEDRNHTTAEHYAKLGLADYEAIEAFVQYSLYE